MQVEDAILKEQIEEYNEHRRQGSVLAAAATSSNEQPRRDDETHRHPPEYHRVCAASSTLSRVDDVTSGTSVTSPTFIHCARRHADDTAACDQGSSRDSNVT